MACKKKHDNSNAYHVMAKFYDQLMGENKYLGWKKLIADVVEKYGIPKVKCLDVACGTGNISKLLVELGFSVVGVDRSPDMISVAKKKFAKEHFVCSDARNFNLDDKERQSITLAVSFYDSLNYLLSDEDMLQTFISVNRNIPKGRIFLFDMNPMDHVGAAQKFKPRVYEESGFYSIFRFGGEGRFWILDIDFFVKKRNCYELIKERHVERGYDRKDIVPLLKKAGFGLLEVRKEYKIYEDGKEHLSRLYFVAQKL
jgi:SAM-dependent methyltransferase